MTNASFRSAGYALMVEDNPDQETQSKRKTYKPVALGSKSQDLFILKTNFGNLLGIPWVCTCFVGNNKAINRSDR